jgi:hypothetical protein
MGNCPGKSSLFDCLQKSYYYADMDTALPPLGINPSTISVSGFASGAMMADQMKVIYPETIKGAAFVSGGPFILSKVRETSDLGLDDYEYDFLAR